MTRTQSCQSPVQMSWCEGVSVSDWEDGTVLGPAPRLSCQSQGCSVHTQLVTDHYLRDHHQHTHGMFSHYSQNLNV